jgi:putative FmdB family regulatory protein
MPIFEYVCRKCRHRFEKIVHGGARPECPACHSRRLEKQLSVFAANTKGAGGAAREPRPGPCGTCGDPRGPGSCSMN